MLRTKSRRSTYKILHAQTHCLSPGPIAQIYLWVELANHGFTSDTLQPLWGAAEVSVFPISLFLVSYHLDVFQLSCPQRDVP